MTSEEFNSIVRILKGSFPYKDFMNDDAINTWFNFLNQFSYEDTRRGVLDYVEMNNRTPTINDILSAIKTAQSYTKKFKNPFKVYVKCTKCNDLGYTIKTYPNGSEYQHICDCERAKEKFPWDFMTNEEREEWYEAETRAGRRPVHPFRAEKEYVRDYLYPKAPKDISLDLSTKLKGFEKKQTKAFMELLEQ